MTENELIHLLERRGYRCVKTVGGYHAILATEIIKGSIQKHARSIIEVNRRALPKMTQNEAEQWIDSIITIPPSGRAFDTNKQHTILRGKEPTPPTKPAPPIKEGRIIDIMSRQRILIPSEQTTKTAKETAQVAHKEGSKMSLVELLKFRGKPVPSRITQARYDADMSVAEMAHELCITVEELQAWEEGTIAPTQGQIIALASHTSYSRLWFYGDDVKQQQESKKQ